VDNSSLATQYSPFLNEKKNVRYPVCKIPSLGLILCPVNLVHILTTHFSETHFHFSHQHRCLTICIGIPTKSPVCMSYLHILISAHFHWVAHPNNIWCRFTLCRFLQSPVSFAPFIKTLVNILFSSIHNLLSMPSRWDSKIYSYRWFT
jgi:hypothetical protein